MIPKEILNKLDFDYNLLKNKSDIEYEDIENNLMPKIYNTIKEILVNKNMLWIFKGYQGHYICDCRFHLNTLIDDIVISTVGQKFKNLNDRGFNNIELIGHNRYYETNVFKVDKGNDFLDIDPQLEVEVARNYFSSNNECIATLNHYLTCLDVENFVLYNCIII